MKASTAKQISEINLNKTSVGYAKPATKFIRAYAMGELKINKATHDLLLAISPFVDSSSRIVINLDKLARSLQINKATLYAAIWDAENHGLLMKREDAYYSNFHVMTTGESSKMEYVRLIDEFTSPTYLNYTKNVQRLLCYFLSSSSLGSNQTYNVIKLYKNKWKNKRLLANKNKGIDIFPTFRGFLNALSILIENDQIEVKLKNASNKMVLNAAKTNIKEELYFFFGIHENTKKSRLTFDAMDNEIIQVKISKRLCKQNKKVVASEYELNEFAMNCNFSAYDLKEEQRNYFIGIKNDLYKIAGETGITIYRKTIQHYFENEKELVLSHSERDKAVNRYVDYYLLPEVRKILRDAALHQLEGTKLFTNGYKLSTNNIFGLISFYTKKASANHLLQLDNDLFQQSISYKELTGHSWSYFYAQKELAEKPILELLKSRNIINTVEEGRKIVYEYANKNWLTQTEKILEDIETRKPVNNILQQAKEKIMQDIEVRIQENVDANVEVRKDNHLPSLVSYILHGKY